MEKIGDRGAHSPLLSDGSILGEELGSPLLEMGSFMGDSDAICLAS